MKTRQTRRFRSAVKRVHKRGKALAKLEQVTKDIYTGSLVVRHRDHALGGPWIGHRELHIAPDWLLVYRWEGDVLVDTGTHADIFG